ncbi:MAG: multiprotein bridging factor aMBF1 [Thermoplasmatales archaeon]
MNCELCGKQTNRLFDVIIDGVHMRVCSDCVKYGQEVPRKSEKQHRTISHPITSLPLVHTTPLKKPKEQEDDAEEPVEDYGKIVKKRREEMGLSQEQLAAKLQEKKNIIAKIEREEIKPDKQIAKKIERVMGIKIIEKVQ